MVTPMVGGHGADIGQLLVQPIEASHGVTKGRPYWHSDIGEGIVTPMVGLNGQA